MVAALASFLDARRNRGVWHLRIDDIDPPREAPGSVESISAALSYHGLHWDGPIVFQSQHAPDYERAIQQLDDAGWLLDACAPAAISRLTASAGKTVEQNRLINRLRTA